MGIYDVYEGQQRKVFWKKARQQIKKDLKRNPETYGKNTEELLSFAIDIKKIWQEPERVRLALFKIFTNISNIKEQDIKDIMKENKIHEREQAIKLFVSRVGIYLKISQDFVDATTELLLEFEDEAIEDNSQC